MARYGQFEYGIYKPTHTEDLYNIFNSIKWHIENAQFYKADGSITNLVEKYEGLSIVVGYPENMAHINPPCLAIDYLGADSRSVVHYTRSSEPHRFIIWGFCGGLKGGEANIKQQINLMHDLKAIFDNEEPGNDYIYLYDYTKGTEGSRPEVDTLQILDVESNLIHAGSSETLEVSRFRFKVEVVLGLYK